MWEVLSFGVGAAWLLVVSANVHAVAGAAKFSDTGLVLWTFGVPVAWGLVLMCKSWRK